MKSLNRAGTIALFACTLLASPARADDTTTATPIPDREIRTTAVGVTGEIACSTERRECAVSPGAMLRVNSLDIEDNGLYLMLDGDVVGAPFGDRKLARGRLQVGLGRTTNPHGTGLFAGGRLGTEASVAWVHPHPAAEPFSWDPAPPKAAPKDRVDTYLHPLTLGADVGVMYAGDEINVMAGPTATVAVSATDSRLATATDSEGGVTRYAEVGFQVRATEQSLSDAFALMFSFEMGNAYFQDRGGNYRRFALDLNLDKLYLGVYATHRSLKPDLEIPNAHELDDTTAGLRVGGAL